METATLTILIVVAAVALFDFTNGFHDASDMVAGAIASRAIRPAIAIAVVSVFTFIAPFTVGLAVADTIGTFVNISSASALAGETVVVAALLAAVSYNLLTWWLGYPSSSSNSLAGGLVGAGLFSLGAEGVQWGVGALQQYRLEGVVKIATGLLASPLVGVLAGFVLMKLIFVVFRHFSRQIEPLFVYTQYISMAWLGFSHGANDAQKGMAIIGMMLLASGTTSHFMVPVWAVVLCASAITLGTAFGGWRIIRTLGFGIYRLRSVHAVASQIGSALVNTIATGFGAPTSTTQVVTATLVGSGAAEKPGHVHWRTVGGIVAGWWLNIPVSILLGWLYGYLYFSMRA